MLKFGYHSNLQQTKNAGSVEMWGYMQHHLAPLLRFA